jgi:predicted transcriptional regulator
MTVYQMTIDLYLAKHQNLRATEIAEDLERNIEDVEDDLNALRAMGKAVEIYDCAHGYVWRSLEAA